MGSPFDYGQAHEYSDKDAGVMAIHHTLGPGGNQAAPGNHSHGADLTTGGKPLWKVPTLLGGWVAYGGAYPAPRFRRITANLVEMQGVVKSGTIGTNIFMLPIGYTPKFSLTYSVPVNAGTGSITILASGAVVASAGNNVSFSVNCMFTA